MALKSLPRSATALAAVVAIAAVLVDPATVPWLAQILGEHAATKVAAIAALIAALGRALQDTPPVAAAPADEAE
jgi:hypothetical protein